MLDYDVNERVAAEILRERRWGERTFAWGDYVILLDGAIVGVAADADAALSELRRLEPDFERGMVVQVAPAVADIIRRRHAC